jgi:hypothetical protein
MNLRSAVPAPVSWALPTRWSSSQRVEFDSQKLTCPVFNAVELLLTAAVRVTTVPEAAEVTGLPAAVTESIVEVVGEGAPIVKASGVVATRDPEMPLIDSVEVPAVTATPVVSVSVLLLIAGFGENEAVTPFGRLDTAKLTLPLNPNWGTTTIVEFSVSPGAMVIWFGAARIVKFWALTVRLTEVLALMLPEVPVIVTGTIPGVALLLAASVSVLLPVAGLGEKVAVTPLGRFAAEKLTLLLNPYWGEIVTLVVLEPPWFMFRVFGYAVSVKLCA